MDDEEANIGKLLMRLESQNPRDRANVLRALATAPLADHRLLTAAERLLTDETLTLLSVPYVFGEVRCLAADAVAALRSALHSPDEVRLVQVPVSLSSDKIGALAREAGLEYAVGGIEGSLEMLHRLRELGLVPRRNLLRTP